MEVNGYEIMKSAYFFANEMINRKIKDEPLTIDVIKDIRSPMILTTKYGKDLVENLILGAIEEYHTQLREKLMESGIDIGEMALD